MCGGGPKEKRVYSSVSNSIEIKLNGVDSFNYLLKYEGKCLRFVFCLDEHVSIHLDTGDACVFCSTVRNNNRVLYFVYGRLIMLELEAVLMDSQAEVSLL